MSWPRGFRPVSHGTVALINRCVTAGLVKKQRSEGDARQVEVHLSSRGKKLVERIALRHHEQLQTLQDVFRVAHVRLRAPFGLLAAATSRSINRLLLLSAFALVIGLVSSAGAALLLGGDPALYQPVFLSERLADIPLSGRPSPRPGRHSDPRRRRTHCGPHGAVRHREDPRPRHSGSARSHSFRQEPVCRRKSPFSNRCRQPVAIGSGGPLRRRRAHHHDGRRRGIIAGAGLSSDSGGTQGAAGCGSLRRYGRRVRHAAGGGPPGGGAAVVRTAAKELVARCSQLRGGRLPAPAVGRPRPPCSRCRHPKCPSSRSRPAASQVLPAACCRPR